jgi:hypothetical protein
MLKLVSQRNFSIGDLVTIKNSRNDERFCIIGLKTNEKNELIAILKALFNDTYITEKPVAELNSLLIKGLL